MENGKGKREDVKKVGKTFVDRPTFFVTLHRQ